MASCLGLKIQINYSNYLPDFLLFHHSSHTPGRT